VGKGASRNNSGGWGRGKIAPFDVVVQQPLGFRGNLVAVDNGFEVGTFQAVRELGRLLMGGATRQVGLVRFLGVGRGFRVRAGFGVFVGVSFGLVPFQFGGFRVQEI
jgi:hypothetical protein